MKMNPVISVLLVVALLNAGVTAVLAYQYNQQLGNLARLQLQRSRVNQEIEIFRSLLNDSLEYSRRNPTLEPVLKSFNRQRPTNATGSPQNP